MSGSPPLSATSKRSAGSSRSTPSSTTPTSAHRRLSRARKPSLLVTPSASEARVELGAAPWRDGAGLHRRSKCRDAMGIHWPNQDPGWGLRVDRPIVSVRRDFCGYFAPNMRHLQGDPPESALRALATRRIPAQADSSAAPNPGAAARSCKIRASCANARGTAAAPGWRDR
jgi:hypothetical protein